MIHILVMLEAAVDQGKPLLLSPKQCRTILAWRDQVVEDKNAVVRENHELSKLIQPTPPSGDPS